MPRLKKAVSKKSSSNATAKRAPKKPAKSALEGSALHKAFVDSLVTVENYWNKKSSSLKKQLDTLRAKHEKAAAKFKAAKGKATAKGKQTAQHLADQTASLKEAMAHLRASLAKAKLALSQYAALSKQIGSFERQHLLEILEEAQTQKAKKGKSPAKTAAREAQSTAKKRGRKAKSAVSHPETGKQAATPKKRGRKPKQVISMDKEEAENVTADRIEPEEAATAANPKKRSRKNKATANAPWNAPMEEESLTQLAKMEPEQAEAFQDNDSYEEEDLPELFAAEEEFSTPAEDDDELFDDYSS